MKKFIYALCIIVFVSGLSQKVFGQVMQEWVQRYTGLSINSEENLSEMAIDGLGNVYVTGVSFDNIGNSGIATIKYNSSGVQLWVQRINGSSSSMAVDALGNVYVTGSNSIDNYLTIKYNSSGVQNWIRTYNGPGNGSDRANSIAVDAIGNVYVTGLSAGNGTEYDYATIKYNSSGTQQWVARYNGPGNALDEAFSIKVDGSGNIYVTGRSAGNGTAYDYATIKYNSSGTQQWVARYNGLGNNTDIAWSLAVDGLGNVYVTGGSVGNETAGDYTTIKYNPLGDSIWVKNYYGRWNSEAHSIAVDSSRNVYVTGFSIFGTEYDFETVKYNSSGDQQWAKIYSGPVNHGSAASSLAVDGLGNVYVTGRSEGNGTGNDYATIKYNSSGDVQWVQRYNGPGNGHDYPKSIAVDGIGNVYVAGRSEGGVTMMDYAIIKYSQQASQLSVISPNGGETFLIGQQLFITWNSLGVQSVKIEFTSNNGGTWSTLSANYPADSGRFAWTVPNINSTQCKIKITDSNDPGIYDISNSSFTISPVTLNTGLIAYYPFNGNVNDESGNNNHGTNNGATFTTDINATQNDALDFNGISNYVSIPDFNILNNNSLTLSCIIYPRSLNTSVSVYHGYSGEIQMNTYNGNQLGVGVKLSDNNWYFSNVNALPNNWYLLTGVWVRGNSIKLYLNGQLQSQNSVPDLDLYEDVFHNSSIGAYSRFMFPPEARPFNGKIDEVRFYNRALSQSEIQKLYNQALAFTKPSPYSKWISGESDTIRWINQGWTSYNIKCLLNYGTPSQSEYIINNYITDTSYIWNIPGSLLSFRSKIIVQNSDNGNQSIESNVFRIKPYLLTKLNPDSTYYEYSIGRDNWRYENGRPNFWFEEWYNQFNYLWIDPFTGRFFPVKHFFGAFEDDFPDWVSWVNAFSIDACYSNFDEGEYFRTAIAKWKAFKRRNAKYPGSCFGIALSNAMAFNHKSQFLRRYPDFPEFTNPHDVIINDNVRKITNELWTHQLGKPHKKFLNSSSFNTFPRETLDSLKDLLLQDNCIIKMLGIVNLNNSKGGAHMILPYKVERLFGAGEYSILTYDNNSPDVPQSFVIKTLENGGNGSWSSQEYNEWGGAKGIILSDDVYNYFFTPLIEQTNATSPFTVEDSLLQVYNPGSADFVIKDYLGNVSGTINDSSFNNIENSIPVYSFGGFEGPPYMFNLQAGSYSVTLKNFNSDKIESYLFTGNKSFTYSRDAISSNQTDVILFDGNITALNEDSQAKQIALSSIIKESSSEKVVQIKSLILQQNDSVKLVNIQDEDFKLISYGARKQYELELDYVAPSGTDRFINSNIVLSANSSHTILPEWNNISNGTLTILEDIGNNGSIDDTINLRNYSELDLVLYAFIEGLYNNVTSRMTYDTVTILLRDKLFPFAIADSANAVLSIQGKGFFTFHNAQHSTPYYLVVKHRNAIEVWSDSTIWLSANSTNSYSFVDSVSFAFGNNLIQVDSSPIRFALFSGDVNQDGAVDASDVSMIDNDATNFISGYVSTDLTGDGFVDGTDFAIADNNAASFVGVVRP